MEELCADWINLKLAAQQVSRFGCCSGAGDTSSGIVATEARHLYDVISDRNEGKAVFVCPR